MIKVLKVLRMMEEKGLLETDEFNTKKENIREYAEQLITNDCSSLYDYVKDSHIEIGEYILNNFEFVVNTESSYKDMIAEWWSNGDDEIEEEEMSFINILDETL